MFNEKKNPKKRQVHRDWRHSGVGGRDSRGDTNTHAGSKKRRRPRKSGSSSTTLQSNGDLESPTVSLLEVCRCVRFFQQASLYGPNCSIYDTADHQQNLSEWEGNESRNRTTSRPSNATYIDTVYFPFPDNQHQGGRTKMDDRQTRLLTWNKLTMDKIEIRPYIVVNESSNDLNT